MLARSFLLAFFVLMGTVSAQVPEFWFSPDTVFAAVLPLDSTVLVAQIDYGDAAATDSVVWAWKRVEWSAPQGWSVDLCDPSVCHTGVAASHVQLPLPAEAPSFLKFLISSRGMLGEAMGTFWVFPEGQIEDHLTLHFAFTAGSVDVPNRPVHGSNALHPNPTSGPLWWREVPAEGVEWTVWGPSGRVLDRGTAPAAPDLTAHPPGTYFITFDPARPTLPIVKLHAP